MAAEEIHTYCPMCVAGLVTGMGSSEGDGQVTMSHGSAFVSPPSLSGRDHSARDLAISSLHPELPRRRGTTRRA